MTLSLESLFQLSPCWIVSLMAFIPLTLKVLNGNKEINSSVLIAFHGLGITSSLILFFLLGFKEQTVLSLKFASYETISCVLVALASLQSLFLFRYNLWIDKKQLTEILFFFSHGVAALYVFCLSQDLMTAFIGLETASLIIYITLAMSRKDIFCLESSMKYFVLSALAGVVFLYGLSFVFGATGSLEIKDFFSAQGDFYNRFLFLGFTLIFCGLFFKVALFPFQFWLADVYQGALTPMTAFMGTAVKSSVILFIGRLFALPFFEKGEHGFVFISGLAVASVLTLLFGSIMALKQIKLKRLVAFSSIAHSGYLMMALVGILSLTSDSKDFSPLVYYLISYIFMTGGLLTAIQCLETKTSSQAELQDLRALFKTQPLFATALSLFLIGLAGLPPTFGFFAKVSLFQLLVLSTNWWILFWAFIGSTIGLYYYIKPITTMMDFKKEEGRILKWHFVPKILIISTSFGTLFGAFIFGFFF